MIANPRRAFAKKPASSALLSPNSGFVVGDVCTCDNTPTCSAGADELAADLVAVAAVVAAASAAAEVYRAVPSPKLCATVSSVRRSRCFFLFFFVQVQGNHGQDGEIRESTG